MAAKRVEGSGPSRDAQAELAWKWLLRICGLATFAYVLITKGGAAPVPVYVIIGGFIGLPNIVTAQSLINSHNGGSKER